MCSSKPSLMHHDAELRVLTFSEPAAVCTLVLFNACGMCAPERGAGEELVLLGRNAKGSSPHFISK